MLKLIVFLDSLTPWVQAIDCLIMLGCGAYCVRSALRRRSMIVILLAISCFISFVILLGYFLSSIQAARPTIPLSIQTRQTAYLIARLLAPFETLFFGIVIFLIARQNVRAANNVEAASAPRP
jgi:hypothetical protein